LTNSALLPGRTARDIQLSRALGVLALAGLLALVAGGLQLSTLFGEAKASTGELVSGWIQLASFLPWLAALVLALDAFRGDGERRARRLRMAAFLAAASFALEVGAGLVTRASLEAPLPRGYRVALDASLLSSTLLVGATVGAARAFASARLTERRERALDRALILVAAGYGFGMISAIYYAISYSNFADHEVFTQGLRNQAFGALGVAVAGAWAASAFRRSARSAGAEAGLADRERRLSRAAWALALSFLIISLGEALIAAGTTQIGYSRAAESVRWVGVASGLATVAAVACAAIGFRRAARG
jgi:hypothetical protein